MTSGSGQAGHLSRGGPSCGRPRGREPTAGGGVSPAKSTGRSGAVPALSPAWTEGKWKVVGEKVMVNGVRETWPSLTPATVITGAACSKVNGPAEAQWLVFPTASRAATA